MTEAYFTRTGALTFAPTELTQGAWREDEQHVSILAGLAAYVIDQHQPRPQMVVSRLTHEILGQIAREPVSFEVSTIRPGRTIELVEATGTIAGRVALRTRAWRLQTSDTSDVRGIELDAMPGPDDCEPFDGAAEWQGNFLDSLEFRQAPGGRDGRRQVWVRTAVPLVDGIGVGPLAQFTAMVDVANGIATRVRPKEFMYPNVELSIHLMGIPDPTWTGLDTAVSFGVGGIGLTSTTLNDVHGPVGRAEQSLTLRAY